MVDLPELHLRPTLLAHGFSDDEIRRSVRAGRLSTVGPGAYVAGPLPEAAELQHVLRLHAVVPRLADGAVVSHVSAAVLHGLSIWALSLDRIHVTRSRRSGGRRHDRIHVHTAVVEPDEIVVVAGLPVTSVARTVVDLARSVPFEQAVVVADAALRGRPGVRELLDAALIRSGRWPGSPAARRAVAFADGDSANPGESRSRVAILRAGLPTPVLQWNVTDRGGRWLGRVDFGWPQLRTVGEFDGRVKYGRLLAPGADPGDAVYAEKLREDALRDNDLAVVRWTWQELESFSEVADRLRRRFRS